MAASDGAGILRGYLANDQNYRIVKVLEDRNLLVPIVGDFAGSKALRGVGKYITDHDATVTAFYTSNVEQYLFRNGVWREFYSNVDTLPTDERSTIIRSASGTNLLDPIKPLLRDVAKGRLQSYADVTSRGVR